MEEKRLRRGGNGWKLDDGGEGKAGKWGRDAWPHPHKIL